MRERYVTVLVDCLTSSISCVPSQCVVIGLQSTGEARTLDQLEKAEGGLTGFVSTAKYDCSLYIFLPAFLCVCLSMYLTVCLYISCIGEFLKLWLIVNFLVPHVLILIGQHLARLVAVAAMAAKRKNQVCVCELIP